MGGFAWVTLATNDSYSLGALVLAHSLRRVGSKHDLAVLVTPGVTGAMREKLASVFSLVQEVNVLDSKDEANLALLARPELGITFTKLHCWRLTQYEKCVFVDADTLVIRNCDELFEREELSAAPDVGWPDCFNSGVFVFKPSQQTFASITSFAATKGSFDGGDQGLLNQYFSDWAHKDISKHLPFIYNMCSTATYSYLPAFKQFGEDVRIIHFIGITKPWLQYFDTVSGQVQPAPGSNHLQPLLQLWWQIFCENVHSQLSPVMAGIAGALAKITLGEARSPEQVAFEEHMRKQSWEQGQIDYMGRDSFDNIWKKISETLSVSQRQPSPPKILPAQEKPTADVPAPVSAEAEPTAKKSEAAVLAEPQQKEDRDLTSEFAAPGVEKLIPPIAEVESQQITSKEAISAESSISNVAVPPSALLPTEPQVSVVKNPELIEKTDKETSALATTTTTLVSSIPPEGAKTILPETPAAASAVIPEEIKTPECQKDLKVQEIQSPESTSSQTLSDSPVPIKVAESVLEAEVKESVTEDLRPVTEEAISSISASAQESVPAVLETVLQAVHPSLSTPNGGSVLDPISEIGNGIDALTLSSPLTVTSAAVSVAPATPEVATFGQTQEIRPPTLDTTQDSATSGQTAESSAIQAAIVDTPKVSTETQKAAPASVEIVPEAKVSTETQQVTQLSTENVSNVDIPTETQQTAPILLENVSEAKLSMETQQITSVSAETVSEAKVTTEAQKEVPILAENVPNVDISTETQQSAPILLENVSVAKLSTETQQTTPVSAETVQETKVLPETEKSSTTTEETVSKPEEIKPLGKTEVATLPPAESAAKPQELAAELTKSTESAIQSVEKSNEPELPSKTEKPSLTSASENASQAETSVKPEEPKIHSEINKQCSLPVSAAPKLEESVVSAKIEETTSSISQNLEKIQSPIKSEEPLTCPLKCQRKIEEISSKPQEKESSTPATSPVSESNVTASVETSDAKVPKSELKEAETSEELASQSESSEESPIRPARTKEMQIPGTPTIIEATPPTSPPIGALKSFEEQPTKTVKKVVKKVVKKSTSPEDKPAEGTETEGEVKKVTKKVVKKVVKKTKEDAAPGTAAETSSGNDKPKKVVKVVKKTTKTGQNLETETNVPETPPPGSSEIPVPPKRKLKTIGKSTPAKSDPES